MSGGNVDKMLIRDYLAENINSQLIDYDYDNLLVDLTLIWLAVFEEQNGVESLL